MARLLCNYSDPEQRLSEGNTTLEHCLAARVFLQEQNKQAFPMNTSQPDQLLALLRESS